MATTSPSATSALVQPGPTLSTSNGIIITINESSTDSQLPSSTTVLEDDITVFSASLESSASSSSSTTSASLELATTDAEHTSAQETKLSRAAFIGIIVGGSTFLLLVFLCALIWILRRRKRRLADKEKPSSGDDNIDEKIAQHSRGPSYDQTRERCSTGDGPLYQPVSHGPEDTRLLQAPALYHDKDPSSEATTPNMRNSVTLEHEPTLEEAKENTPLDPFSSGYIPPPSPTPSEYVIVQHTPEPLVPPRVSRDKRESRSSLLDTIVPEEGKEFSTLGSVTSGRQSAVGHRRTMSGGASTSGTQKRTSRRLQKPRPSIESTSSLFRSRSPSQIQRSVSPIKFPRDPFEASLEEETLAPLRPSFDRPSIDRPSRSSVSHEMREVDGQKTMSIRPSMDTIASGGTEKGTTPSVLKKHIRSPSSPSRLIPNSPSVLGLGKKGASVSVLSLQHQREYEGTNAPYINMGSPTMADASVYDFDIYKDREPEPPLPLPNSSENHPPISSSALFNASKGDPYGSQGSKKRFSASMSDLPTLNAPLGKNRCSASMSTNQVHLHGKEGTEEKRGLEPTTNLYIPKESLDLPS